MVSKLKCESNQEDNEITIIDPMEFSEKDPIVKALMEYWNCEFRDIEFSRVSKPHERVIAKLREGETS